MKKKLLAMCIVAVVMGMAALSFGSGFKVAEQGAKAVGMANAFVAQADDPSALAYNPAGIAFLKGDQFQVSATTIFVPQTEFTGTTKLSGTTVVSEKANRDIFIAPTVYASTSLENIPLSFGLGINSFYPLAKRWDDSSEFRDKIQSISIKPINFQPTAAYRFDDLKLSIAAGFDITYAQVSLQKMVYVQLPALLGGTYAELGTLGADATATGYGYNFGLLWKPLTNLSFGAAYRSSIKLDLQGDANYIATTATGRSALLGLSNKINTSASTEITLPDELTLGVSWKPIPKWTLEFDANWTGWSSYKQLELKFGSGLSTFNGNPEAKNWKDVWAYRLGTQYAVTPKVDLRAGYAYDTNPAPDDTLGPELPDADRHNVSLGMGLHNDFGAVDLSYMWVHWVERTVSNVKETGTFKSDCHIFVVSVSLKF
jgi:long-chain fatty acid transport protein